MSLESDSRRERLVGFLRDYYGDEIASMAQVYPSESRTLEIAYSDLFQYDASYAGELFEFPDEIHEDLSAALRAYDLPADISFDEAQVRVGDLDDDRTFFPGSFSPKDRRGQYLAVEGEVGITSDVYADITHAAFECQRCGTMNYVREGGSQPHECDGCERQGPWKRNFNESEFDDVQKIRVQEPPEVAAGEGREIDVYLREELVRTVEVGDRVRIAGVVNLREEDGSTQDETIFTEYLDGEAITVVESDHADIEVTPDERDEIHALAAGERGDPLEVAAESFAPKIVGYDLIKRMLTLALVRGVGVTGTDDDDEDRGHINMLLIGDPGTAKSKLIDRAEEISPRSIGITGKMAREAGVTATAERDDFSGGKWTLKAGALVRANGGVACIDELDDMDTNVRAAMLEPMSKGKINVSKASINTTLTARTGVLAAGNPTQGRFDRYQPVAEQFDFDDALLSRFDLIFTTKDDHNPDQDAEIADHITGHREFKKRLQVEPDAVSEEERESHKAPVSTDLFRKWVALAQRSPPPIIRDESVRQQMAESFASLRGANGYDDDSPIPVTYRKLEAVHRIAEAAARFELSETIEGRHVKTAMNAVGESMQQVGKNEDGELDSGTIEKGTTRTQDERRTAIKAIIAENQDDYDEGLPREEFYELTDEAGLDREKVDKELENHFLERGEVYEPRTNKTLRTSGGI